MADARTTVLLTGFGPFPGVAVNATMRLVPLLAERAGAAYRDLRIIADILPTEWRAAPARLDALCRAHHPDLVLHFGVSSRARGFEIEMRARNVRAAAADACGEQPEHACIQEAGPEMRAATVPVTRIVGELRRIGVPAFASRDAGTYLCNALLYASAGAGARTGFIHVPARLAELPPGPARSPARSPLSWPQALAGSLEIVRVCLGRPRNEPRVVARRGRRSATAG